MELICVRHGRTRLERVPPLPGPNRYPARRRGPGASAGPRCSSGAASASISRWRATWSAPARRPRAIFGDRDVPLELSPQLREMHFGLWEGLTWHEIVARWPEAGREEREGADALHGRRRRVVGSVVLARRCVLARDDRAHACERPRADRQPRRRHARDRAQPRERRVRADADGLGIRFSPGGIIRARGSFADGWELVAVNETADSGTAKRTA